MKPLRKKAREELDIVSVIEWQSSPRPEDRLFLLTKRPEGGKTFTQFLWKAQELTYR
jgi:A/G-specific adenine glycosylase